ncbi:hypothetical protein [Acidianus sp. RZ1]|uniref:hypothetical protein n=1 Tax=Acidianus sp. RZ1 TaxID=1540082 RepID=UPI0014931CB7|nr:hypothetical protein [Acidianus sp. RZ1]NON62252.1 hypothetical protein [Acidianus sp. RZ1]
MVEVLSNEGELKGFLQKMEDSGVKRVEIVISEETLEKSPAIAGKYGYAVVDGEDLPGGLYKLTLELRGRL